MKQYIDTHALKFLIGFLLVLVVRFIPFRPPNVEPVMATMMPFAKRFGACAGFAFPLLSIVLFDLLTMRVGVWTLVTALAYGLVGVGAHYFFKRRESTATNYALFAVVGTPFFDAVTGLTIGPLLWGQPFMVALIGQIPFTALHLMGNVAFALVVSPLLYRWVVGNTNLTLSTSIAWTKQAVRSV